MANKYVRKAGNDSTGDGSTGNPWLTVDKALKTCADGDTILVGTGTYQENTTNGTLSPRRHYSSMVTIAPETGVLGDVTLQGSSGTTAELWLLSCGNITFSRLVIPNRDATVLQTVRFGAPTVTLTTTLGDTIGTTVALSTTWVPPTAGGFVIKIDSELMLVTATNGVANPTCTVTRGYNSTTAATHTSGATVATGLIDNIVFDGCSLPLTGTSTNLTYAVIANFTGDCVTFKNVTLNNCTITGTSTSTGVTDGSVANVATGGRTSGFYGRPYTSATYYVFDSITFTNNTISCYFEPIRVDEGTNVVIRGNTCIGGRDTNGHGISLGIDGASGRATSGTIEGNVVSHSASHALLVGFGAVVTCRKNWVYGGNDATAANGQGLVLKSCDSTVCEDNFVLGGYSSGIYAKGPTNSTIRGNCATAPYANANIGALRQDLNSGALKTSALAVADNRWVGTVGPAVNWVAAGEAAQNSTVDYNIYEARGGTLGAIRGTTLTDLTSVQATAWSGYGVAGNDAHSLISATGRTFSANAATGNRLYAVMVDGSGNYWTGTAMEAYNAANWMPKYGRLMGEITPGSGVYDRMIPHTLPANTYAVTVYRMANATFAQVSDPIVAAGTLGWDGTTATFGPPAGSVAAMRFDARASADRLRRRGIRR